MVDDYTPAVDIRPLRLKSEVVEAFKASQGSSRERAWKEGLGDHMGNTPELSIGKMRDGIMPHITVPYTHQRRARWPWLGPSWISGSAHSPFRAIAKGNVQTRIET